MVVMAIKALVLRQMVSQDSLRQLLAFSSALTTQFMLNQSGMRLTTYWFKRPCVLKTSKTSVQRPTTSLV